LNKQKKKGAGPDISVIISIFLFASQRRLERDLWYLGGDWEGLMVELATFITLDHGEHKSG
jgi:hypothetical protein